MDMELKTVHHQKAYGGDGSYELEIKLAYGRELTQNDQIALYRCARELMEALDIETKKIDPKFLAQREATKIGLRKVFEDAGLIPIYMREIQNQYWSPGTAPHDPWFLVTTFFGIIKIGWRKRVINIDYADTEVADPADKLFPNEDVTKDGCLIHAWSYEKATEYVRLLASRAKELQSGNHA